MDEHVIFSYLYFCHRINSPDFIHDYAMKFMQIIFEYMEVKISFRFYV